MKKRIVRVPLKQDWLRVDYLNARSALRAYNKMEDIDPLKILCSFCQQEITSSVIRVVAFGASVACGGCYVSRRFNTFRQRYRNEAVPPDLNPPDAVDNPGDIGADVEKAVEIQDENIAKMRKGFKKLTPKTDKA